MIKDDIDCLEWVNNVLMEEMSWQELPELKHDSVKLSAELDVFYKSWNQPITLANNINQEEILKTIQQGMDKYDK